ncbi:MAG: phosphoglucosamine mutase [Candidatus Hadarchaeales archaeon]
MKGSNHCEAMKKLFGTSGVRGVVGREITPEMFVKLGKSLSSHLGNSGNVVVGRDPRVSSEMLESALISGLLSGGCDVKRVGMVPTPIVSFAVERLGAKTGAMITASHNPPEYNGVKFWDSQGWAYSPEAEEKIEKIYFGERWSPSEWNAIGRVEEVDVVQEYLEKIKEHVEIEGEHTVVVDCGNGATSNITPVLLRELGCKVIGLNCQADGRFPGRGLEPTEANLKDLCATVRGVGADLGIAHDGDGDRVVAVDEKGNVISGDELLAVIAAEEIKEGDVVATTVDASRVVDDAVGKKGGKVVRCGVGDVNVAVMIKNRGAVFGGEPCGAWIFPRISHAPDGPLGAAKILEMTGREKISEIVKDLPKYWMVRRKIPCQREIVERAMKAVEERLAEQVSTTKILRVDGVRVETDEGWVLVRPSGTEPCIRITAEGTTTKAAESLADVAGKILAEAVK